MPTALRTDPLSAFHAGCRVARSGKPMPLVGTHVAIALEGGLAVVSFKRTFRNVENESIEATITFPVPVDAVLTGLVATVDDRVLIGSAEPRAKARATYEAATDAGKSAVLHEEVLKGVHVLTVGHIPAGKSIEVLSRWVQPLSFLTDAPSLHIPITTGEIYGRSPLLEVDDLLVGDVRHQATIEVSGGNASAHLHGRALIDGRTSIDLDEPIDLVFTGWTPSTASGNLDGRLVEVDIGMDETDTGPLCAVVLADRSGSMQQGDGDLERGTKFDAMRHGLRKAAAELRDGDAVELWQFASSFGLVGSASDAQRFDALVDKIDRPNDGTEIGIVVAHVVARNPGADILLVTDGRSHALDVAALSKGGHRITTVLIGKDALEANVGHLSGLTGGQIFVASGGETSDAIVSALRSMRRPWTRSPIAEAIPSQFEARRGGARARVALSEGGSGTDDVGAYVAGIAIANMPVEAATALAVKAGIVCHLTSLVLVDEAGDQQEGVPAMRKVPLSMPKMGAARGRGIMRSLAPSGASLGSLSSMHATMSVDAPVHASLQEAARDPLVNPLLFGAPAPASTGGWSSSASEVDWSTDPRSLQAGDLGRQSIGVRLLIASLETDPELAALSTSLGIAATVLALAVLATASADRYAARFLRTVVPEDAVETLRGIARRLGHL